MGRLIEVENLTLKFRTVVGLITAVENVSSERVGLASR